MKLQTEKTGRGFRRATFQDFYAHACSIQESSIATDSCVWLGCEAGPQGESNYRMHLTRTMAATLLFPVSHFVLTGSLPDEMPEAPPVLGAPISHDDARAILLEEFGRWLKDDAENAPDAFTGEIRNAIRMGAMGALSNVVARLVCGQGPSLSRTAGFIPRAEAEAFNSGGEPERVS